MFFPFFLPFFFGGNNNNGCNHNHDNNSSEPKDTELVIVDDENKEKPERPSIVLNSTCVALGYRRNNQFIVKKSQLREIAETLKQK